MRTLAETTGCRWPIDHEGATWFCDAPVVRGSYCSEHGRVAFEEPKKHNTQASLMRFAVYLERRGL